MADKPSKKRRGRPPVGEDRVAIQFRAPASLADALEEIAFRNKRTRNAELSIALEQYLAREGMWPPAKKAKPKE